MIQLHNIDCMEYMASLPDKAFELAIVDPPYGIGMGSGHGGRKWDGKDYASFYGDDSSIPSAEYFIELRRVSHNQIVWGGNYMSHYLGPTRCFIIWDKAQPVEFSMAMCEYAWASFDQSAKLFRLRIVGADSNRIHPTQKPVALYKWLLKNYAKPNDRILDTHLGSGSIAIACHDMGFDLVGCELDKDYYEAASKRLKNHQAQGAMF
jgi:site-specific DNA-methyltransferase (adenine-specific)